MSKWQQRSPESLYAVVFRGAIHGHVRSEGHIVKEIVYIAIGIKLDLKNMYQRCGELKTRVPTSRPAS
ncbi:transposase [Selenomonas ruminantium]|uniref:transposase n=1 Tax=Selenomonas ruminantium TaxID=971 RepID=UPI00156A3214